MADVNQLLAGRDPLKVAMVSLAETPRPVLFILSTIYNHENFFEPFKVVLLLLILD